MLPTLMPSEEILVDGAAYAEQAPQIGDLVVLKDPRKPSRTIVKRVSDTLPNQMLYLLGDNPDHSTDSRTFGPGFGRNHTRQSRLQIFTRPQQ